MKVRFAAAILVVSMAGCGSRPLQSKTPPEPLHRTEEIAPTASVSASTAPVTGRVTLPYMFTRHGVEIRVNSIEFVDNRVLVNLTFRETRGQTFEFAVSTLMQTLTTSGHLLTYAGYSLAGKTRTEPAIRMAEHGRFSITLLYELAPGGRDASGNSFELRFPTGKYWRSRATRNPS